LAERCHRRRLCVGECAGKFSRCCETRTEMGWELGLESDFLYNVLQHQQKNQKILWSALSPPAST
jgi:hypothetical protein